MIVLLQDSFITKYKNDIRILNCGEILNNWFSQISKYPDRRKDRSTIIATYMCNNNYNSVLPCTLKALVLRQANHNSVNLFERKLLLGVKRIMRSPTLYPRKFPHTSENSSAEDHYYIQYQGHGSPGIKVTGKFLLPGSELCSVRTLCCLKKSEAPKSPRI